MTQRIEFYLNDFIKNDQEMFKAFLSELDQLLPFQLPLDYIDLTRKYNGGEGEVGENSWLILFPIEELLSINQDYEILMKQIPNYFLFGKDAADTGYAFHKTEHTYHSFGLMSNFKTDPIEFCGNSMLEFLEFLHRQ